MLALFHNCATGFKTAYKTTKLYKKRRSRKPPFQINQNKSLLRGSIASPINPRVDIFAKIYRIKIVAGPKFCCVHMNSISAFREGMFSNALKQSALQIIK